MEIQRDPTIVYDDQGVPIDPVHRNEFSFFGNGEFKPPPGRVVGVYYDKQRRIWRANWREGDVGKRKTKNFSVDDYGFEEARRLAIEYRLMKITEIAQMELNCPEIDRIRLSTCRAPAQPSLSDRRKRILSNTVETPRRKVRGKNTIPDADPYLYNGHVPPPSGEFYDPNDQYGAYWQMPFYYNQQQQQPQQQAPQIDSNYMWYYSPDILYNLYNQAATPAQGQVNNTTTDTFASMMSEVSSSKDEIVSLNKEKSLDSVIDVQQQQPIEMATPVDTKLDEIKDCLIKRESE